MGPGSCHRRRSAARRGSAALLGVTLALGVGACGDDESTAAPSDPTSSATASPAPSKKASPALSELEGEAPVKAARRFIELVGRALNKGDASMRSVRPAATSAGVNVAVQATAFDRENGYRWPGPEPFTPISVRVEGNEAEVPICFQTDGWSIDPKTNKRVGKREIEPYVIDLRRVAGRWKVDDVREGVSDCAGVQVKGVKW